MCRNRLRATSRLSIAHRVFSRGDFGAKLQAQVLKAVPQSIAERFCATRLASLPADAPLRQLTGLSCGPRTIGGEAARTAGFRQSMNEAGQGHSRRAFAPSSSFSVAFSWSVIRLRRISGASDRSRPLASARVPLRSPHAPSTSPSRSTQAQRVHPTRAHDSRNLRARPLERGSWGRQPPATTRPSLGAAAPSNKIGRILCVDTPGDPPPRSSEGG